jgi:hypothetical protein
MPALVVGEATARAVGQATSVEMVFRVQLEVHSPPIALKNPSADEGE